MAIRALTLGATFDYVLKDDPSRNVKKIAIDPEHPERGEIETGTEVGDDATVFKLRPLDVFMMGHIYDRASILSQASDGSTDIKTRINETNIEAVRFGCANITNLLDARGEPVKVRTSNRNINGREYPALDDSILMMLGIRVIAELAQEIKNASEVKKDDEKNSD